MFQSLLSPPPHPAGNREAPGIVGKEESQDSWWDREQQSHTGGTVPPQSAFGSCLDLPVPKNHLEPLGIVREIPEIPQGRSGSFHEIPSWNGPGLQWGLVSPSSLSLLLGTPCGFSSVQEQFPSSHRIPDLPVPLEWGFLPSWWDSAGAWNVNP